MSHTRRIYPGPTPPRVCKVPVVLPGHVLPLPCGDKHFKAGRCLDHYTDWRNARESRQGAEAVNSVRRERRGTPLPKDLSRVTVPVRMAWAEKHERPTIDDRRRKQGVSQATQDYLIERAARKRALKAGIDLDALPPRKRALWRAVRR